MNGWSRYLPRGRKGRVFALVCILHILVGGLLIAELTHSVDLVPDDVDGVQDLVLIAFSSADDDPALAAPEEEGEASAPDIVADPVPVIAPPPDIEIKRDPPIQAAPAAAEGKATDAGSAVREGPGTGDGQGDGFGTGARGSGIGGGGAVSRARKIAGDILDRDYPRSTRRDNAQGTVTAYYDVGADGRVYNCTVRESSGNAALDAATCRLIEERFRYEPARNVRGEPVPDVTGWRQVWWRER
ncbi:TonB family protein [Pacificimonas sp. WHA3]|uniref:TonB family protein n=1 Tax=Pacificimonas pallii TaxID=2827236 RepID=A0ABS6SEE2_9SPHN|nr:energy transducer TonB [Pacificimonas pallii]MBV7256291.1 TonB family protein [Pacificimonas pallii]